MENFNKRELLFWAYLFFPIFILKELNKFRKSNDFRIKDLFFYNFLKKYEIDKEIFFDIKQAFLLTTIEFLIFFGIMINLLINLISNIFLSISRESAYTTGQTMAEVTGIATAIFTVFSFFAVLFIFLLIIFIINFIIAKKAQKKPIRIMFIAWISDKIKTYYQLLGVLIALGIIFGIYLIITLFVGLIPILFSGLEIQQVSTTNSSLTPLTNEDFIFVGTWKSNNTYLEIFENGKANYKRETFRSKTNLGSAKIIITTNKIIIISLFGIGKELNIDKRPYLDNNQYKMIIDGEELIKK